MYKNISETFRVDCFHASWCTHLTFLKKVPIWLCCVFQLKNIFFGKSRSKDSITCSVRLYINLFNSSNLPLQLFVTFAIFILQLEIKEADSASNSAICQYAKTLVKKYLNNPSKSHIFTSSWTSLTFWPVRTSTLLLAADQSDGLVSSRGRTAWNRLGSSWSRRWSGRVWFPRWRSSVCLACEAARRSGKLSRATGLSLCWKRERQVHFRIY